MTATATDYARMDGRPMSRVNILANQGGTALADRLTEEQALLLTRGSR